MQKSISGGRCTLVRTAAFARPIRLSVRPSVCLSVTSRSTAKTVRDLPMVHYGEPIGCHHRATQVTHLQPPTTTPSPNWGLTTPPIKTYTANCGRPNGARYNGIDRYWQPTGTYHCPTQQYHCRPARGTPSPKWGKSKCQASAVVYGLPTFLIM